MKRFLAIIPLAVAVGCGKAPPSSPPAGKAAEPTVSELVHVPFQQVTITDEHGMRTITVPAVPAAPAIPAPTVHSVVDKLDKAIKEIAKTQKRASNSGDLRTIEICGHLLDRLREVTERLNKPDHDLAHELEEIGEVMAVLSKGH